MSRKEKKSALPSREELLLRTLKDLEDKELKEFKWYLQKSEVLGRFPVISKSKIDKADRPDVVDQMLQTYCENTLEVTKKLLRKIDRNDLVKILAGPNSDQISEGFAECQKNLKSNLLRKFQGSLENVKNGGKSKVQEEIYIEVHLSIRDGSEVVPEHELKQTETASRKPNTPEKNIKYVNIFETPPGRNAPVKKVLTIGVAGIGKTLLTQKFSQDWAEDKTNQYIHFLFPFTFRELNLLKERKFTLAGLVHYFFPETKEAEVSNLDEFQVVFIFDGLDECRLPLDFRNNKILTDVTESTSVDVLLTNLIKGKLLPSARLWITSRPAAANQIPAECVDMVTEVLGFSDAQKLDYFMKKCNNKKLVSRIMPYIKSSPTLNTMCHIPVFCWITATVLEEVSKTREEEELPKSLTELYIHLLLAQSQLKGVTETGLQWIQANKDKILNLGKLAFEQLQKGHLVFYESDLKESGISVHSFPVYTSRFTEIFKEDGGLHQAKVFRFTHLSIQEFLAALYVHMTFVSSQINLLEGPQFNFWMNLARRKSNLYHTAVDSALQSSNGHLDLFLRFLLGLSLPSSQDLLKGLLNKNDNNLPTSQETIKYIKEKLESNVSTEKSINLFHCLNELNDSSLTDEIQQALMSGHLSVDTLSPAQWSALVFILLSSENNQEIFDLQKYSRSEEALLRLLPVVKAAKTVVLSSCNLSERGLDVVSSVLSSQLNSLKELDLSNNNLQDSGVQMLTSGLKSPHCSLEILRLRGCKLSWRSCDILASIISSLSSCLKELDISNNDILDVGVRQLSAGLENPQCTLETLRLTGCQVTEEGVSVLVTALNTNPNHLKELDLSYNHPGESGVKMLTNGVKDHQSRLEALRVDNCGEQCLKYGLKKYACEIELDPNTAHRNLKLSEYFKKVTVVKEEQPYPDHLERFDHCCWQVMGKNRLTGYSYWEVELEGSVIIAVSYKKISRRGQTADCRLGWNDQCWSLVSTERGFSFWHNKKETVIPIFYPSDIPNRLAVYVDHPSGIVSFYNVSSDTLNHLHTFHTTFTAPVYPAFGFGFGYWSYDSSVSLC